jgi:hypothetical protein
VGSDGPKLNCRIKQSDAELILPSSRFDLGGLVDRFKAGIPGGAFITPVLQVQIPLYLFYTVAPVALLALHAVMPNLNSTERTSHERHGTNH